MKKWLLAALIMASVSAAQAMEFQLGAGAHYWRTLDEIGDDSDFDEDGVAYMLTTQIGWNRFLKLEGDLEVFPDGFAGATDTTYAPQAFVILGSVIYGGLGVGTFYSSEFEDDFSDPFYVLRAGINLKLLPHIVLDINANYHFMKWEMIEDVDDDIDSDTLTLGAMLRFQF